MIDIKKEINRIDSSAIFPTPYLLELLIKIVGEVRDEVIKLNSKDNVLP